MSKKFGHKLRNERKLRKWTQEEVSHRLQVTQSMISKWEKGVATPQYDNLIAISRLFDLPLTHFVNSDIFTKEELAEMANTKADSLLHKGIEEFLDSEQDLYEFGTLSKEEIVEALQYIKARRIMQRAKVN